MKNINLCGYVQSEIPRDHDNPMIIQTIQKITLMMCYTHIYITILYFAPLGRKGQQKTHFDTKKFW